MVDASGPRVPDAPFFQHRCDLCSTWRFARSAHAHGVTCICGCDSARSDVASGGPEHTPHRIARVERFFRIRADLPGDALTLALGRSWRTVCRIADGHNPTDGALQPGARMDGRRRL